MFARLSIVLLVLSPVLAAAAERPSATAGEIPAAAPATVCAPAERLAQLTQTECCKARKGICGCRAGKIVCCDGTSSKEPGCTCHGADGFAE